MDSVSSSPPFFSASFPTDQPENTTAHDEYSSLQKSMHILSMVVYSVACLLGVTGNGLVIWITGFKMKKTVNSVWFLNLAIADFIFTFFLPLSIAYTALGFHWPFGKLLCKLNSTTAFLNMFASVFLLTVISMDRCVSVAFPVWSHNRRSPELAARIAVGTWVLALLLSSPYLVFRDTALSPRNSTSCYNNFALSDDYSSEATQRLWRMRHKAMIITRFLCGFLIPFAVILICYSIVAVKLKRRQLASSAKPYRIIIAVTVSFFLCYFPYHVFSLLELSKNSSSHEMKMALYIGIPLVSSLAFFNSCINPILGDIWGQILFAPPLGSPAACRTFAHGEPQGDFLPCPYQTFMAAHLHWGSTRQEIRCSCMWPHWRCMAAPAFHLSGGEKEEGESYFVSPW
uniref:G-protein coupled receptors family 1 profile domain-containing protein n=1 Tax=Amazona collaria TaxID=241587 RepID=A0A8B9FXG8_9PSIT